MDEALMHIAHVMAARSTCSRTQVGAVVARDGRVLASGYNGTPSGMPHCDHTCNCLDYPPIEAEHNPRCRYVSACLDSVHAEANAVAFAARLGTPLHHGVLYTTHTPCRACAQLIVQAGVVEVHAFEPYRDAAGWELLADAGLVLHGPPS